MTDQALDRRTALKARHRQAILDAASSLIQERGTANFSVDELAERADVARRTIFNHFASLDEIVMTTCTRVLTDAVEQFRAATVATPGADGSRAAMFTEITGAMRAMDLATIVAYLGGVLGDGEPNGGSHLAMHGVFARSTEDISREIAGRSVELDELEAEILVSSLMNGLAVISRYWLLETGGALDASSRAVWNALLDRLVNSLRGGYSPPS